MINLLIPTIFALICFAALTVHYFIEWLDNKADINSWLGWLNALMWCIFCLLKI